MKKPTQQAAADLSHQIRNRLTYIMLSSAGLCLELRQTLSEEQRKEFGKIDVAAEEIRGLLDNLLNLLVRELAEPAYKEEEIALLIGG
jgi:signal transduction histidine kinase